MEIINSIISWISNIQITSETISLAMLIFFVFLCIRVFVAFRLEKTGRSALSVSLVATGVITLGCMYISNL